MIDVMMFPTGVLGTNTYVIKDKETDFIAIVDPGCEDRALTNYLDSIPKIKVRYILLTHGHLIISVLLSFIKIATRQRL
ncbi:MAG: MBL fold metallo-hydrolase [Ruminococcus sp.]|nr:MBL fold metallo-hydrolase [Ruminococcus sp.]